MELRKYFLPTILVLFGFTANVNALENIEKDVLTGCDKEIEAYCSQVTKGEGRLLACFYAHEDKLSGRCGHTLYQASAKLKLAAASLNYVAGQCKDDILSNCADVEMGEGRVLACLKENSDAVSDNCETAIAETFK